MLMKINVKISFAALALFVTSAPAAILTVNAQANIFGAGHAIAPGGGILPTVYSFSPGTSFLTFSNITGTVSSGADTTGPDGAHGGPSTDMSSISGISGIKDT